MWEIKEKPTLAKLKEKLHKSLEHFLFMSFSKEIIKTQNHPVYLEKMTLKWLLCCLLR